MENRYYHLFGKRYLGNIESKKVHDLENEDREEGGCQIGEITIAHIKLFDSDTYDQAKSEGYKHCEKCEITIEIED